MQNLVEFNQFVHKTLHRNEIQTPTKGRNSVINLQKLMCNNPNLYLVNIKAYAKFCQTPSICSQAIARKQNSNTN